MKVILRARAHVMKVILSARDEGYSRNASCTLNVIYPAIGLFFIIINGEK